MLHLFPPSSLDNSILTSVLVGVLVVWFFQESLGWNFTGLVVPGYLASILVIEPPTGLVIVVEALATWLVFTALSDKVPLWWPWSPLFGRDRFFGLLLASVGVRVLLEGGGFTWLQRNLGVAVDTELHSMSLVVVPLAANAVWRTGFVAALTRIGVPVVITWAILQFLLLRTTNLSLSSFELTYEDLALDFVSSPRAYILLLCGAWLGSAANVRWGWDYGGIIVPGLLSVCWLEPGRLAATLFEVAVIATAMRFVVRLPFLKTANLTGGRPLVLAFCLGYAIKFALGWTLGSIWPGLQVRELFGFGYLLPTMIALRVIRAGDDVFRPMVPAMVTSFAGFSVGSALGYALAVLVPAPIPDPVPSPTPGRPDVALALHAWADEGRVPDALALLGADRLADATWSGGDGFGGLWIRADGEALVVTGRVGEPGMPTALTAIAEATHARAVLLCGREGGACESVRRDLARRVPVLRVEVADRTVLRVSGRLDREIETRALSRVLGPVGIEPGGADAELLVDRSALVRAAAAHYGRDPAPLGPVAAGRWIGPARGPDDPAVLRVLAEEVVGCWDVWRRRAPGADDASRVAAGLADALGFTLSVGGDRSVLAGPGFRAVLDRRGGDGIVHVPAIQPGDRTRDVARVLWVALGASALVEDAPSELGAAPYLPDRAAQGILVELLERMGPETSVVTVRPLRDSRDAGAELVLSNGRPLLRPDREPAVFGPLRGLGAALDVPTAAFDGALERAWLVDSGNVARLAARAASGAETQATVFVGPRVRARLGRSLDDTALGGAASRLGIDVVPFDPALLAGRTARFPSGAWAEVHAAAEALARTGARREHEALRARARDATIELLRDDLLGTRWLRVARCEAGCAALYVPIGGALAQALPDTGADPVVAAIALGTGAWVID